MLVLRLFPVLVLATALSVPVAAVARMTASPLPSMSAAPTTGSHHHHRRPSLMRALDTLDLTAAQKQQVATFRSQERQANENADAPTKRTNAQKMRTQILGILTPDQQTQLRAEMRRSRAHTGASDATTSAPNAMSSPMAMPMPATTP